MANITGDPYVLNVQEWLNENYSQYVVSGRYHLVEEDGIIGWGTIYGLTRAFQIELGIQSTADNFGPGTVTAFNAKYARAGKSPAIIQQASSDTTEDKVYGIIQGALLCKGYWTGVNTPTLHFYGGTGDAIKELKNDAGIADTTSDVTLNIMKALLSMDYFYSFDSSSRTQHIVSMQRYLNRNYENYIGLRPCDGVYSRGTSEALIYAIQAEEDMPISVANGNCGPSTKRCLPPIPYTGGYQKNGQTHGVSYNGQTYSNETINRFKKLLNMALYFNGLGNGEIVSSIDTEVIEACQRMYSLNATGIVDYSTWLALLISCGDVDRAAIACDCATIITNENVGVLTNNNYKYIGRYLSGYIVGGASKALSTTELQTLFNNNIRLFPIHQRSANAVSYFNEANAVEDADSAYEYAESLHLQFGSIIYFAVDCDAMDYQITDSIIPYFKKLFSRFMSKCRGKYRVGIYGTRNVCTRVCNAGYACSSFVGDMSTGFSGNLGFSIPSNWALDQFATTTITHGGKSIEIDKNGFSGQYKGISQEYSFVDANFPSSNIMDNGYITRILINMTSSSVPVYKAKVNTGHALPTFYADGDIIGYIKPNDFYLRYPVSYPDRDNIHKVMFNDGTDVKIGYITEKTAFASSTDDPTNNNVVNLQILDGHDAFTCAHYDSSIDKFVINEYPNTQEFTIKKPVVYFSSDGSYAGTLQAGDKIRISGNNTFATGNSRPWCNYVDQIKFKGNSNFETFGKFVSTGLEYGTSKNDRAWL